MAQHYPRAEILPLPSLATAGTVPWALWQRRSRTRRQLKELYLQDVDRVRLDLGLHASAVRAECRKWFWQD